MRIRRSPRVKVKDIFATVRKKMYPFKYGEERLVRVCDVGPRGFSFESEDPLEVGSSFRFVIALPEGREVPGKAEIKNIRQISRKLYVIGVEITKLSHGDRKFFGDTKNLLDLARIKFHGTGLALHDRLKILRNALGMTAAELAKASGVPASHISLIESGMEQTPSPHVLSMIAKGLGLTVADLTSR